MPLAVVRIIVDGEFSSGKTRFIRSISETPVNSADTMIEAEQPEIPATLNSGSITVDEEIFLFLLEKLGARRHLLLQDATREDVIGYVVMVDSAKPETLRGARSIVETHKAYGTLPYVVAANKQDMPGAWPPEQVREALQIPDDVPVIACVATEKESVKAVLVALLERVIGWIEAQETEGDEDWS